MTGSTDCEVLMETLMKPRQWITTLGLFALVVLAAIGLIFTRGWGRPTDQEVPRGRLPRLVDEQPLVTARSVASLASDRTEQRFAQQTVKLADNEVDLAFAEGMREAAEFSAPPSPEVKELMAREVAATAAIKTHQAQVDQLKKQADAASGARHDDLQQQLDVMRVQLELDQDELDDVKSRLLRSSTDPLSRIQRQFNRHEADEHALEVLQQTANQQPTANSNPDVNYLSHTLWNQVSAWRALRSKKLKLQQALDEANSNVVLLSQKHNGLLKRVQEEKAVHEPEGQQSPA